MSFIVDRSTNKKYDVRSKKGMELLSGYIKYYQSGGSLKSPESPRVDRHLLE